MPLLNTSPFRGVGFTPTVFWDSSINSGFLGYTNQNLTVTKTAASGSYHNTEVNIPKSNSTLYFEITADVMSAFGYIGFAGGGGLGAVGALTNRLGQDGSDTFGWRNNGSVYWDATFKGSRSSWTTGDVLGFLITPLPNNNGTCQLYKNGVADGAAFTTITVPVPWHPAVSLYNIGDQYTGNWAGISPTFFAGLPGGIPYEQGVG